MGCLARLHDDMSVDPTHATICQVLQLEADSICDLIPRVGSSAVQAVERLLACRGRIITTGMGKMGFVARKAAATLASTGTPAFFLQASEALHGDLGIVTKDDLVLALSNSGETEELIELIPHFQRAAVPIVALTGSPRSTLARASSVVVDIAVTSEADADCPAPTCSTTAALAMCDALAVALLKRRGLTRDQFAIFHPGGQLGRRLLLTVGNLMKRDERIPTAVATLRLRDAIVAMSRGGLGAVFVVDDSRKLLGILTDGDLRRIFQARANPLDATLFELMVTTPHVIAAEALAAQALRLMEDNAITVLPVVDADHRVCGALHLHDLLHAQLV